MELHVVDSNNLYPFRARDESFLRPRGVGLLPGRLLAGISPQNSFQVESVLGLEPGELRNGRADSKWPSGFWQHLPDDEAAVWIGLRTDAHAPLFAPPPTMVPLPHALQTLLSAGFSLSSALLLEPRGWSEDVDQETIQSLMQVKETRIAGIAGFFAVGGSSNEKWQIELYGNGMLWAETPTRLEIVASSLAPSAHLLA